MPDDLPSPLAVMMTTMHKHWNAGEVNEAVALAKAVAPYMHAKAVAGTQINDFAVMRDDQLNEFCTSGADGTEVAEGDQE